MARQLAVRGRDDDCNVSQLCPTFPIAAVLEAFLVIVSCRFRRL